MVPQLWPMTMTLGWWIMTAVGVNVAFVPRLDSYVYRQIMTVTLQLRASSYNASNPHFGCSSAADRCRTHITPRRHRWLAGELLTAEGWAKYVVNKKLISRWDRRTLPLEPRHRCTSSVPSTCLRNDVVQAACKLLANRTHLRRRDSCTRPTNRCNFVWSWKTLSGLQNFKFISNSAYAHKSIAVCAKALFIVLPQIAHLMYGRHHHHHVRLLCSWQNAT